MFIYKVEADMMEWHERLGFHISQRRSVSCNSCDKLYSSWQVDNKPKKSEPHDNKTINLTHVNEAYNICENKLSAEKTEKDAGSYEIDTRVDDLQLSTTKCTPQIIFTPPTRGQPGIGGLYPPVQLP